MDPENQGWFEKSGGGGDEAPDEDLRKLERSLRRKKLIKALVVLALIGTPVGWMAWNIYSSIQAERAELLTAEEEQELAGLLDRIEQEAARQEKVWQAAVNPKVLEALEVGEAPCQRSLEGPTLEAGDSYVKHGSIDGNYFGSWGIRSIEAGQPLGRCSDCEFYREEVRDVRGKLGAGTLEKSTLAWARRQLQGRAQTPLVLFQESERQAPAAVGESFDPGLVRGRAWLYDPAAGRIVCGGEVEAENSTEVNASYSYYRDNVLDQQMKARQALQGALERDLEVQLRRAIARSLKTLR